MAQNNIPENRGLISGLGEKMKEGLTALGVTLGITQITTASFGALLDAFNNTLATYNGARSSRQAAYDLFHGKDADLVAWLKVVRGVMIGYFGNFWNTMWAQAGWVQPSTAIPKRVQQRVALALKLRQFFTASPSYEVADRDVTAAEANTLRAAVLAAQVPLQTANVTVKTAENALIAAQAALVKKMRDLVNILRATLAKDDPRWEAFGLNIPAMDTTPAAPTGLRATMTGSDLLLECDVTALATRYRFRRMIVGVDTSYKLVASSPVPMALLEGVASGLTMEFIVQAVNGSSQSVASNAITVVTPPAPEAAAISDAELAPLAAIVPNGSSNGNGNGSSLAASRA